jgi:hypothetical protein
MRGGCWTYDRSRAGTASQGKDLKGDSWKQQEIQQSADRAGKA